MGLVSCSGGVVILGVLKEIEDLGCDGWGWSSGAVAVE